MDRGSSRYSLLRGKDEIMATSSKSLFKIYGKMSMEELLKKAAELKETGDKKALVNLAKENGLDKEDAEDFINGEVDEFATPVMAAIARLEVEESALEQNDEIVQDWISYIKTNSMEKAFALQVMNPEKSIEGCIAKLLEWSFKHSYEIDKSIMEKVEPKIKEKLPNKIRLGIPGSSTAKLIIHKYYKS